MSITEPCTQKDILLMTSVAAVRSHRDSAHATEKCWVTLKAAKMLMAVPEDNEGRKLA